VLGSYVQPLKSTSDNPDSKEGHDRLSTSPLLIQLTSSGPPGAPPYDLLLLHCTERLVLRESSRSSAAHLMSKAKDFVVSLSVFYFKDYQQKLTKSRSTGMTEPMFMKAGKYVPLWKDVRIDSPPEDEPDFPIKTSSRTGTGTKIVVFLLTALLTCLALMGAIDLVHRITNSKSPRSKLPCYCGSSVEEAQSLGCKYVPMASAYLPPHCRDDFLDAEFNRLGHNADGSWTYYADYARTTTTNLRTIATFGGSSIRFYNDWEWHVMHCLFYWRKLQRAQFSGVTIEPRFNTDAHISHCARLILSRNVTSTTVSGVDMGDEYVSEEELRSPATWDDIRDGYGNNPPDGYLNDINSPLPAFDQ
jgi:hypothetical protein